ncbi:PTS ascorbate transporter subunit IIC [Vallitalea longa]|uniref:Ascorbate-specific PTS system EIIC component n=1 Tax=Vallitalea longa TaxID=2936439 RepID=A0A9W6DE79_9FIRM|nr:PTS ascorbate transporter subunit IIC [Vallitalea longa]GKX29866.1 PTS ascorbate transporter subunit IIC [Vallitalea longa]
MDTLNFIFTQILGEAYILLALVTLIGYIALKEPLSKAIAGSIKTAVGVLVLGVGSSKLTSTFGGLLDALNDKFGMTGVLLDTYSTMVATNDKLGEFVTWTVYTMLGAFIINIILVALRKYTKIRAVFLTGNVMLIQTAISTFIVYNFLHTSMLVTVLIASSITALYWGIMSTLLIKPVKEISGGADFTIGHQQMLGSLIAYKIAPKIGNKDDDIERIKLPNWLSIFQDNVVASSIVLLFFVTILMVALGKETVTTMAGGTNWIIYIVKTGLTLAVSLYILLTGVRMFVSELMYSFQGISEKILPGAVVAVDCAAVFGFAPKAVLLGFVGGAIGMIFGVVGLIVVGSPILIIPGFIPMFFDNAVIGIFANKRGGWKATLIITFCSGIIQVVGSGLAASALGINAWQGSFDWATIWLGIIYIFKCIGSFLGIC